MAAVLESAIPLELFEQGDVQQLRVLLLHGADDVNETLTRDGRRPLHYAALYGQQSVVDMLLQCNADINATDQAGLTALHLAARRGHVGVVDQLLMAGAQVYLVCQGKRWAALHEAARGGAEGVVRLLLAAGAHVEAEGKDRERPIHLAAQGGHVGVLQALLAHSADCNASDQVGWTPLHLSVERRHDAAVALLAASGAHLDATSKYGWTPLHLAAQTGNVAAVKLLIAAGASLTALTKDGKTGLQLAIDNGQALVLPLLMQQPGAAHLTSEPASPAAPAALASTHSFVRTASRASAHGRGGLEPLRRNDTDGAAARAGSAVPQSRGLYRSDTTPCEAALASDQALLAAAESLAKLQLLAGAPPEELARTAPHTPRSATSTHASDPGEAAVPRCPMCRSSAAAVQCTARVPDMFRCPLSGEVMEEAVVCLDGYTYDRRSIQRWFDQGFRTSPLTHETLRSTIMVPNLLLRCALAEWRDFQHKAHATAGAAAAPQLL